MKDTLKVEAALSSETNLYGALFDKTNFSYGILGSHSSGNEDI
jgi:hypothetical protein